MTERTRRDRWLARASFIALAIASIALFIVSRGKWSDAIIDSGREWIVPDALAQGDLLYRDVVYWFGPFTPYFHAAFFALFGSGFRTLVVAGVVGSIGVLAALHFALRTVTGRREAFLWTALAIPALVFMPNAGGSILGMGYRIWHAAAFALVAIALASKPESDRRPDLRAAAAGLFCALSGLCRTEWGAVALVASALVLAVEDGDARSRVRSIAVSVGVYVLVFGGTIGGFIALAGWKAVVDDGHVLLTGLPPETREFLVAFSGVRDWRNGILELLYSAAMWVGAFLLLSMLDIRGGDPGRVRRMLPLLGGIFLLLGLTAVLGGAAGAVTFSAAPLLCAGAVVAAWLRRRSSPSAGLLGFGFAGTLLFYRRPFHITDSGYVAPPLLLAFVCAAALLHTAFADRSPFPRARQIGLLTVIALAFLVRFAFYAGFEGVEVPGTQGMFIASEVTARRIAAVSEAIDREVPAGGSLVVFPEGELLNEISRRGNPLRHKLYIPGYLSDRNEGEVLGELSGAHPAAIVIWYRPTGEYGRGLFGVDYAARLRRWMEERYHFRPLEPAGGAPPSKRLYFLLGRPR